MTVPDPAVLLGATAAVAAGTAVQVLLGFGVNLLLVPVALLLWPGLVPVPAMVVNLLLSAGVAMRWRGYTDPVVTRWALAGSVPGLAAGAWLLAVLDPAALGVLGAAAILGAVLMTARGPTTVRAGPAACAVAGAGSAVLGTTAAVTGPPIALLVAGSDPRRARATVAVTGTVTALVALVVLLAGPLRSSATDAFVGVLWLLPGIVIGWLGGHALTHRVSTPLLRRAVLVVSAASAVAVLVRAVT
ncbi:TSUP family transporter [Pseudonocardia parietis]|uniref:Probable membrane transporter protein n=1 Tax=Pseudonocardia parietis TaxID=570936 RepID=A0ABS4VWJ8_9PSEU|nr:TSUP family transporter [Pseudonocardia parietis]MBP2368322.1 putative membrane protein YfcA [Pseudonocardia parietis]